MKLHRWMTGCIAVCLFAETAFAADQKAQDIYQSKCQGCHGAAGHATNIGKKLGAKDFQDPDVLRMTASAVTSIIKHGKNKMPSYNDVLTNAQIRDLAGYIKQLK
jgi:mono/diheme cytochrome c family protein